MEREIANVAAACAMRGFRYMAFPPITFDAPPVNAAPVTAALVEVCAVPVVVALPVETLVAEVVPTARPTPVASPPPHSRRFALLADVSAELRRHETR